MMRDLRTLDAFRFEHPAIGWMGDETCGCFTFRSKMTGDGIRVIASSGYGWDHVSVSLQHRCPNWPEMEQIRRMFFCDEEFAFQYHAPVADYMDGTVHGCVYCLHLWRPHAGTFPIPPKWMVGMVGQHERG
jgi:hypothetical protein